MNLRVDFLSRTRQLISSVSVFRSILRFFLYTIIPWMSFSQLISISKVASGSMTPTILTHDLVLMVRYQLTVGDILSMMFPIIIDRLFTHPDSILVQNIPLLSYVVIKFRDIEIGDVVTFVIKGDESMYTKRIIAKENDKVQMFYGRYYVNNTPLECKYVEKTQLFENEKLIEGDIFEEKSYINNKTYQIIMNNKMGNSFDISDEFIVDTNSFFVSGDNRHNSDDGRSMLKSIHRSEIKYQVKLNLFSNSNLTTISTNWFKSIRTKYCCTYI